MATQIWEMTLDEWRNYISNDIKAVKIAEHMGNLRSKAPNQDEMRYLRDKELAKEFPDHSFCLTTKGRELISHRKHIVSAIKKGFHVPVSVLRDYPDLHDMYDQNQLINCNTRGY